MSQFFLLAIDLSLGRDDPHRQVLQVQVGLVSDVWGHFVKEFLKLLDLHDIVKENEHFGLDFVCVLVQLLEDFVDDEVELGRMVFGLGDVDVVGNPFQGDAVSNLLLQYVIDVDIDTVRHRVLVEVQELLLHSGRAHDHLGFGISCNGTQNFGQTLCSTVIYLVNLVQSCKAAVL